MIFDKLINKQKLLKQLRDGYVNDTIEWNLDYDKHTKGPLIVEDVYSRRYQGSEDVKDGTYHQNKKDAVGDKINETSIRSTAIDRIAYDPETNQMILKFNNNPVNYSYEGVPEKVIKMFLSAPSKGKFYNRYIKGNYS